MFLLRCCVCTETSCSLVAVRLSLQGIWFHDASSFLLPVGNSTEMNIWSVKSDETGHCGGTKAMKKEVVVGWKKRHPHGPGSTLNNYMSWVQHERSHLNPNTLQSLCTNVHTSTQTRLVTDQPQCVRIKVTVRLECVFTVYSHHLRPPLNTVSVSMAWLVTHVHTHTHAPATVHRHTPQQTANPPAPQTNTYCWA